MSNGCSAGIFDCRLWEFLRWALVLAVLAAAGLAQAGSVNPPLPTGTVLLGKHVLVAVEVARTREEKVHGLSNRPPLAPGHGMLFVFDQPRSIPIWMKEMQFSVDIVWIAQGKIVYIEASAPPLAPEATRPIYRATGDMVLEVPAGFCKRHGITIGTSAALLPAMS
jgi:hypothetical protein